MDHGPPMCIYRICKLVTENPVLKYFDINEYVTIKCNASKVGLGAILYQKDQPFAYASCSLPATEQHYAQIEKECLAIFLHVKSSNITFRIRGLSQE